MLLKRFFIFIFCISVGLSNPLFSQINDNDFPYHEPSKIHQYITAEHKVVRDDPNGHHELYVGCIPFYVDASTSNLAFGAELDLGYNFKDIVGIDLSSRFAYIDRIYEIDALNYYFYDYYEVIGTSFNPSGPQKENEILLNFTAFSWTNDGISTMKLGEDESATYSTEISSKKKRLISIRLGYQAYSSFYNPVVRDGVHAYLPFVSQNQLLLQNSDVKGGTMVNYNAFIAGISFDTKLGLDVLFDKYGRKKRFYRSSTYFDFIYAQNLEIEDMRITNNDLFPLFIRCELQNVNHIHHSGFRLGVKDIQLKAPGVFLNFEVGLRPGMVDYYSNLYAMAKLGFTIGGELKKQEIE